MRSDCFFYVPRRQDVTSHHTFTHSQITVIKNDGVHYVMYNIFTHIE